MRKEEEIVDYKQEAFDKVWLIENCDVIAEEPFNTNFLTRYQMERILISYDNIPDDGYNDWKSGYWHGILDTLRWVLDNKKEFSKS